MTRRKERAAPGDRFDIHCHYFNGAYAFREMLAIGWNATWGHYPHRMPRTTRFSARRLGGLENWPELVRYVAHLFGAVTRDCGQHWAFEQACYRKCFGDGAPLLAAPLMMDIYYMFDDGEDTSWSSPRGVAAPDVKALPEGNAARFQAYASELKDQVLAELGAQRRKGGRSRALMTREVASEYFADPAKWKAVFARHKKLKVNFAHFGREREDRVPKREKSRAPRVPLSLDRTWTPRIIELMETTPNVYADLSYCPEPETLACVETMLAKHSILADRLMFGTDYLMVMLERGLDDLGEYFRRFRELPPQMFSDNSRRFLERLQDRGPSAAV